MQISSNKLHKALIWPTIIFGFIIFSILSYFIYKKVYIVYIQADNISEINTSDSIESIDLISFDEIIEKIDVKTKPKIIENTNNLFK